MRKPWDQLKTSKLEYSDSGSRRPCGLNRPERHNAFNLPEHDQFEFVGAIGRGFSATEGLRFLLLRGARQAFPAEPIWPGWQECAKARDYQAKLSDARELWGN